jgi:hypothetical protein
LPFCEDDVDPFLLMVTRIEDYNREGNLPRMVAVCYWQQEQQQFSLIRYLI